MPLELWFEKNITIEIVIPAGSEMASGPVIRRMTSFTAVGELLELQCSDVRLLPWAPNRRYR